MEEQETAVDLDDIDGEEPCIACGGMLRVTLAELIAGDGGCICSWCGTRYQVKRAALPSLRQLVLAARDETRLNALLADPVWQEFQQRGILERT